MARNLIFCFDGTGNEPKDAVQSQTRSNGTEDESISNILKLHLLFGGDLSHDPDNQKDQLSLYYQGVGTYGSKIKRLVNVGLALKDPGRIINEALSDLNNYRRESDIISVFGFSVVRHWLVFFVVK